MMILMTMMEEKMMKDPRRNRVGFILCLIEHLTNQTIVDQHQSFEPFSEKG